MELLFLFCFFICEYSTFLLPKHWTTLHQTKAFRGDIKESRSKQVYQKIFEARESFSKSLRIQAHIQTYTRIGWKILRLTKILSWNVTKWVFFFRLNLSCSLHTKSIGVAVIGSHWSKKSSTTDMTPSYELLNQWTFQLTLDR